MQRIKAFGVALVCLAATAIVGLSQQPVAGATAVGVAAQDKMPAGVQTRKVGDRAILTDAKGMTLYIFQKDVEGKSACTGGCIKNWPALAADADAKPMGAWTVITRDDGSKQWAYKNQPLYTFVKDSKPGDVVGDNVGAWRVAVP
jgi:predicted lipoprotein with Yx(FWY)xxD motif